MSKNKMLRIFCLVVGIVFLVSGFGKIFDVTDFAILIDSYGLGWASNLAPLIVIAEIVTGLLLIFMVQLHRVSIFAILMLSLFTIAYGYGYWMNGVENCGCFGTISKIKTPFWFVFLRNSFLIYFMVETFRQTTFEPYLIKWKPTVIQFSILVVTFISGLTFYPSVPASPKEFENDLINKPISYFAPMNEFLSSDSSYAIFVFSYSCSHCWNSIENLKQYEKLTEIDKVIGITSEDKTNSILFQNEFDPQFPIYIISTLFIESIVKGYPTTFYVKNGFIRNIFEGELPCSLNYKQIIESEF